jgi:flagellar biogenesis protein FliO
MTRLLVATVILAVVGLVVRARANSTPRLRGIRVTARTAIARGSVVAVVEIDDRRLLIGAGGQQVTLLAELAPEPPLPFDPGALPPVPENPTSLVERFRQATSRTLDPAARVRARRGGA